MTTTSSPWVRWAASASRSEPAFEAAYGEFGASGQSSVHEPCSIEPYTSSVDTCTNRPTPAAPGRVEQHLGAQHVGGDERDSAGDRPVDVRFRREMDDRVVTGQQVADQVRVADVALDEA